MTKEMEERLSRANTLREEEKYGESAGHYVHSLEFLHPMQLNNVGLHFTHF